MYKTTIFCIFICCLLLWPIDIPLFNFKGHLSYFYHIADSKLLSTYVFIEECYQVIFIVMYMENLYSDWMNFISFASGKVYKRHFREVFSEKKFRGKVWRRKILSAKNVFGEYSVWRKSSSAKILVGKKCLRWKIRSAKMTATKIPAAKILSARFPRISLYSVLFLMQQWKK